MYDFTYISTAVGNNCVILNLSLVLYCGINNRSRSITKYYKFTIVVVHLSLHAMYEDLYVITISQV